MWYGLYVGRGEAAHDPSMKALAMFLVAFIAAGQPLHMAVFSQSADPDESGREDVTLYFSPSAAEALRRHFPGIAPCDRPARGDLQLLAGDQNCWPILFA